jgi:predicted nuclease of predicted toxin-antitoxin system
MPTLVLLSLMTFIFVVKVSHAHAHNPSADRTAKINVIKHSCAICDYHFTKDIDYFQAAITILSPIDFLVLTTGKISNYVFAIPHATSLRGPPFSC